MCVCVWTNQNRSATHIKVTIHQLRITVDYNWRFFLTCSNRQWDGFFEFKTFIFVERKRVRQSCVWSEVPVQQEFNGRLINWVFAVNWHNWHVATLQKFIRKREKVFMVVSKPLQIFLFSSSQFPHANSEQTPSKVQKKSDFPLDLPSFQSSF